MTRRHANLQGPPLEPPAGWLRPVSSFSALPLVLKQAPRTLRSVKQFARLARRAWRMLRAMNGKGVPTARQRRINRQREMQAERRAMRVRR